MKARGQKITSSVYTGPPEKSWGEPQVEGVFKHGGIFDVDSFYSPDQMQRVFDEFARRDRMREAESYRPRSRAPQHPVATARLP